MAESCKRSGWIGYLGEFAIVVIALKLVKAIDWPWRWVLAPVWIPVAVGLALFAVWAVAAVAGKRRRGGKEG
jgi:hypothetical protein